MFGLFFFIFLCIYTFQSFSSIITYLTGVRLSFARKFCSVIHPKKCSAEYVRTSTGGSDMTGIICV
jgi:hypothetical protein